MFMQFTCLWKCVNGFSAKETSNQPWIIGTFSLFLLGFSLSLIILLLKFILSLISHAGFIFVILSPMEDSKDLLKNVDWKTVGNTDASDSSGPVTKKRLPKRIRQVPEYYFLPRRSLPSAIAIYGACIAAGVGAGMLLEVWINKKIKEDGGGVVWEM